MIPGNATPIQGGLGYCWQTVFGTGIKRYEPTHGFRAILSLVYLVASFRHFGNVPGGSAAHGGQLTLPTQPPYHHRRYVRLLRAAATSHSTLPSCPFREATGPLYRPCGVRTAMIADDDAGMLCTPARPPHGLDAAGLANIQQKLKCVVPSPPLAPSTRNRLLSFPPCNTPYVPPRCAGCNHSRATSSRHRRR